MGTPTDAPRRMVAIYRSHLLPMSETFIRDQALSLRSWRPILVGERVIDGLDLAGLEAFAPYHGPATLRQRVVSAAFRRLGAGHPRVAGSLRCNAPALVHAHFGFDGVEAWPLARRFGVPLLVTLHGSDITVDPAHYASGGAGRRWRAYPRRFEAMIASGEVSFVAVSESIRAAAIGQGIRPDRVTVCQTGIDTRQFVPATPPAGQRGPGVLFVGRLVEKKGLIHLLRAMAQVRRTIPTATLTVAGNGPLRARLEQQALELGGGVSFLGAVDRGRVLAELATARVFCLPSIRAANGDAEGFGLVILEAQASGVPVVTSARGGAEEGLLDGTTGFAFAEGDEATLAARLCELLADDALADRMSLAGPPYTARDHDIRLHSRRLEAIYDDVVARHGGGRK